MTLKEKIFLIITDIILVFFSIFLAILVRFDGVLDPRFFYGYEWLFIFITICCIGSYYVFGLYEKLWRYAGIQELKNIFFANLVAFAPVAGAVIITKGEYFSRSIVAISGLLTFFFTGGIRFLLRIVHERMGLLVAGKRVIIVGANDAGESILREMLRKAGEKSEEKKADSSDSYLPVGFIDEDPNKKNIYIHNVPVLGTIDELSEIATKNDIEEIIIALPSPSLIQKVVHKCESLKVEFKVIPSLSEIISGRLSVSQIRKVKIEDLLEREEVSLDCRIMDEFIRGKRILVTGAGGSIGSELCRQVLKFNPEMLILLGRGENSIYEINLELKNIIGSRGFSDAKAGGTEGSETSPQLVTFIADIRDETRIRTLLQKYRPHIIFHTAAHKHVPLMEHNVPEAITNNVFGTRQLLLLLDEYGAESFILLSTDKAVNPTSIMGASKRLSEMIMKAYSKNAKQCKFSAVRFGNVLDSRGSVVPTFRRQIAMGGPVTVTDEKMTRYFMTIPEAVQLVVEAGTMGEAGEIFILDMGKPVRILDLAKNMIRLSGFEPGKDIPVEIKGVRPGEKLEEELVNTGEKTEKTKFSKILRVITDTMEYSVICERLDELKELVENGDEQKIREKLKEIIPNYNPGG
ncbi:MAG: polysaccharide biosynthesis protein [Candidatus Eremiobacteraeota bacterium]|nr:polysaccharide biosynthesis protein [Candidatus Eremiobacteraeota bacterium]